MHLSLGKPLSGPYVWHVKDETEDPDLAGSHLSGTQTSLQAFGRSSLNSVPQAGLPVEVLADT